MYTIECRYEYLSKNGKVWTKWFPESTGYTDKEKVEKIIKERNDACKKDKMKHEYKIVEC